MTRVLNRYCQRDVGVWAPTSSFVETLSCQASIIKRVVTLVSIVGETHYVVERVQWDE